mgnify:CR=1 FL=1
MERKKSALSGLFNAVNALENVLLAVMVIGMIVTILLQIGGRLIGHPFPWTEETSRYLFLWMMFVALAAGFNQAESSRVTLLLQIGPKWLKKRGTVCGHGNRNLRIHDCLWSRSSKTADYVP